MQTFWCLLVEASVGTISRLPKSQKRSRNVRGKRMCKLCFAIEWTGLNMTTTTTSTTTRTKRWESWRGIMGLAKAATFWSSLLSSTLRTLFSSSHHHRRHRRRLSSSSFICKNAAKSWRSKNLKKQKRKRINFGPARVLPNCVHTLQNVVCNSQKVKFKWNLAPM